MAETPSGPFRAEALERLSSPERLDQLLQLVDRRSWLPLLALGGLVFGAAGWAVFSEVPINVEGRGILIRPRGIAEFRALGEGYLVRLNVHVGDAVEPGTVLAVISRPELEQQLELERAKVQQLVALKQTAALLRAGPGAPGRGPSDPTLDDYASRSHRLAETIQEKERQSIQEERARLEERRQLAASISASLAERLAGQRGLRASGIVAEQPVLDAEQSWIDSVSRLSDLDAQLDALRTRELEAEDRYLARLQRIADFKLELQDYEQQIAEATREIARFERRLKQESQVASEHAGRVLELSAVLGQFVQPGHRLGAIEVHDADASLRCVGYFTVRDGKRLDPEKTYRALVTPDTVERARYGGIVGSVAQISPYPVTLDEAESVVGNRETAEALLSGGYRMQVVMVLTPAETRSGYFWSSSRGPDLPISAGTTVTVRVPVERHPPITFVLPYLRTLFGID